MSEHPSPADDAGEAAATAAFPAGWQPLPPRARTLFVIGNLVGFGLSAVLTLIPTGLLLPRSGLQLALALGLLVLLPAFGTWLALKRYRYTRWLLDGDGFALRRGRLWQSETRVPATRVQHLDLKRGPLERRFGLSTLVVHTAGTRNSSVTVQGLDHDDAERLRDHLARQLDDDHDDATG